ncbi:hypothetical protein KY362_07075 [Candidatus Woesearchaeota archaeon]|nr:hypothetical protein [Candidatus Woesearchaeota archaeon]
MEEEEIEIWYEEQKQLLSERYMKHIEAGVDRDKRAAKFNNAMEKLFRKYNALHAQLMKQKEAKARRKKVLHAMGAPFVALWRGISWVFRTFFRSLASGFKLIYGKLRFTMSLFWIRKAHKIYDPLSNMLRPVYYWHAHHTKPVLVFISAPFIRFRKYLGKKREAFKEMTSAAVALSWKYTKLSAKFIFKKSAGVYKAVSARMETHSKRYHAWYAAKVQERADLKQAHKEAREQRKKDREEAKQKKAEAKQNKAESKEAAKQAKAEGSNALPEAPAGASAEVREA